MHSFDFLIKVSTQFTLDALNAATEKATSRLKQSGSTPPVQALQAVQLQKAVIATGAFSIFEATLQDRLKCKNGFSEALSILDESSENHLKDKFSNLRLAVNVLKHGKGRSYDELVDKSDDLDFRILQPDENFFNEGDVSEVYTLVKVDDKFVLDCVTVISQVADVIRRHRPNAFG